MLNQLKKQALIKGLTRVNTDKKDKFKIGRMTWIANKEIRGILPV